MIKELLDQALNFVSKGEYYAAFSRLAQIEKLVSSSIYVNEGFVLDTASKLSFNVLAFESASKKLIREVGRLRQMVDHSNNLDIEEALLIISMRFEATLVNAYIEKHGDGVVGQSAALNSIDDALGEIVCQPRERQKFIKAATMVTDSMGFPIAVHSPFLN